MDQSERYELATNLRKLVTGRMTNDAFDDLYYEKYCVSEDPAVREIARFGWSLYSSDLIWSYKLIGRYALPGSLKKRAAHAVLFLNTSQEYQYPIAPDRPIYGLVAVLFGFASLIVIVGYTFHPFAFLAAITLILIVLLTLKSSYGRREENTSSLDLTSKIWPFANDDDLAKANGNAFLLSGFTKYETT